MFKSDRKQDAEKITHFEKYSNGNNIVYISTLTLFLSFSVTRMLCHENEK
jgi:hypothetical protein